MNQTTTQNTTPYMSPNLREFNRLFKEFNDIYRDAAQKLGLSNSTLDILYALCELGDGCLQRDICRTTFIPKQTIHSAISKMEQEGYVTLSHGKGRSMHIYLTDKGHTLIEQTMSPLVTIENEAFSCMSEEECHMLLALHSKYIRALRTGVSTL